MVRRVEAEKKEFEAGLFRMQAARTTFTRLSTELYGTLGMDVLQGDTDHLNEGANHVVLARDYSEVKKKFFKNTSSAVEGTDADYNPFYDVDASGSILARDYSEVKKRFFQSLVAHLARSLHPDSPPSHREAEGGRREGDRRRGLAGGAHRTTLQA